MTFEEIETEARDKESFKKNHPILHKFEKNVIDQGVDKYSNQFVQKLGYRKANWLPCVWILMGVLFIMNAIACYARPDFLTQLTIVLAIFFLSNPDMVKRNHFRALPVLLLISMIYDAIYLFGVQEVQNEGRAEGNIEAPVKAFAIEMAFVAFCYKVSTT